MKETYVMPPSKVEVRYWIAWLRLLRPKDWVKNSFVLAPLIFASRFNDINLVFYAFVAVGLFCLASSTVYILNDIRDVESDRKHPLKSLRRPLAHGDIAISTAWVTVAALLVILAIAGFFYPEIIRVIAIYLLLNVAYSFYLKAQPVVDIFCIAAGFVLRVYAGAEAIHVVVSSWMFITVFCLSLFLASMKRLQELKNVGTEARNVLSSYTIGLAEKFALTAGTLSAVFYSLFVMSMKSQAWFTVPVVLFGLFRYWYIFESETTSESPTDALFKDIPLLVTVVVWIALWLVILERPV